MMKLFFRPSYLPYGLLLAGAFSAAVWPAQADQIKANNNNPLESGSSWTGSIAPAGNENAIWNSTIATAVNCTNTLGSAVTWGGIAISNPIAPVCINGIVALTLSNGISLANATVNLAVDCSTLNLGANQTWSVTSGRVLTTGAVGRSGSVNSPNNAVTIAMTDDNGRAASTSVNFDTFDPNSYTFEAEDFDYNSGQFFDNPQHGAYAGRSAVDGIDYHSVNSGQGNHAYRPNPPGLETEGCTDRPRLVYSPGLQDYDVGFNSGGNWGNYTRTFPSGTYNIYLRAADGIGASGDSASLSVVTSGQSTTNQSTTRLGTFSIPFTGDWQIYTWVPLKDGSGDLVQITNDGSLKTWRVTTDNGNYNANFYILIPAYTSPTSVALTVSNGGVGDMGISFPTQPGYTYQVEYKTNLTDAAWVPLGNAVSGDGTIHSLNYPAGADNRFYRVQIQ
jgi:hypothetical protein